jgi:hypothetical protein
MLTPETPCRRSASEAARTIRARTSSAPRGLPAFDHVPGMKQISQLLVTKGLTYQRPDRNDAEVGSFLDTSALQLREVEDYLAALAQATEGD